jgi:AcrR family transcriptional regulator
VSEGGRRISAEERRKQIIENTVHLVAKHGVEGTTTMRIAKATGVAEPTLYRYFPTRRDMLLAALDDVFDSALQVVSASTESDVLERLRGMFRFHSSIALSSSEEAGFQYPLFEFFIAPAQEGFTEDIKAKSLRIIEAMAAVIEEGKAQGRVRDDVDATQAAWELMGIIWMEDVAHLAGLDDIITDGRTTTILDRVLRSISNETGDHDAPRHSR